MRIKDPRKRACQCLIIAGSIYISFIIIILSSVGTDRIEGSFSVTGPVHFVDSRKAFESVGNVANSSGPGMKVSKLSLSLDIPILPLDTLLRKAESKAIPYFGYETIPYLKMAADGYIQIPGCSSQIPRPFDVGAEPVPVWQPAERDNFSFTFSAFADLYEKDHHALKVIGIRRVNPKPASTSCFCRFWFAWREQPEMVGGLVHVIPEGEWPDEYRAVMFECPLTRDVPYAVSLIENECDEPTNLLYVRIIGPPATPRQEPVGFTCCVPPLHSHLNTVLNVIEWIETNIILGADRFIVYNHSVGPDLQVVLKHYEATGKVVIVPWHSIPVRVSPFLRNLSDAQILYFGQSAAINDCLYRSMGQSKYVVFMDTDEFVFPRRHRSWMDMIRYVESSKEHHKGSGMYWIRNSFMDFNLPGNPDLLSRVALVRSFRELRQRGNWSRLMPHLRTMVFNKRRDFLWPYKLRSKMIVIPERITQVGIHFIHRYRPGYTFVLVQPDVAILQHYRHMRNVTDNYVVDNIAYSYKDEILQRVWQKLIFLTDPAG